MVLTKINTFISSPQGTSTIARIGYKIFIWCYEDNIGSATSALCNFIFIWSVFTYNTSITDLLEFFISFSATEEFIHFSKGYI